MTPSKSQHPPASRHAVKKLGKGYMQGIILALLADHPRYGYEILQAMAEASDGWRPSPGTIYPILHDLYENGLITKREEEKEGRRRIVYWLRPKGRIDLEKAALQHARFVAIMRKILGEHGVPDFPHPPSFNVDKALAKLEHTKLFLSEVGMLPKGLASNPEKGIAQLQNRLNLLKDHEKTVKWAIDLVKNEIQNMKNISSKELNTRSSENR
ncbi:MAG: PadR family transcriptional regulator [Candidatus Hodarchaeota archaeon]